MYQHGSSTSLASEQDHSIKTKNKHKSLIISP